MSRTIIANANWGDGGSFLIVTQEHAEMPASNLLLMQPRKRYQSNDVSAPLSFVLDAGSSKPWNIVAPLFTNATERATFRVTAGDNPVTLLSAPSHDSTNGFGSALHFDGVDDGCNTSAVSGMGASWTLEAWIRPDTIRRQGILAIGGSSIDAMLTVADDGRVRALGMPGAIGDLWSANPLVADVWVHVAMTYDAGANRMALVIGGLEVDAATSVSAPTNGNLVEMAHEETKRFHGIIDEVRLWNVARTPAQIAAEMNAPISGTPAGLIGYWRLDEATGTTASDAIGSADGSFVGAPVWAYPDRVWASPGLDHLADRHGLYYVEPGVTSRYVLVMILDEQNPDGWFRMGRLYVAGGWLVLAGGRRYGDAIGSKDYSRRTTMPNGSRLVRRVPPVPTQRFVVRCTSETEMLDVAHEIDRIRGGSRDVLVVFDPDDRATRHQKMLYGLLSQSNEVVNVTAGVYDHAYSVEGLL